MFVELEHFELMCFLIIKFHFCFYILLQPNFIYSFVHLNEIYKIFGFFDRAILLSAGRVIYSGPANKAMGHFESLGLTVPLGSIPAEFLLQVCGEHLFCYYSRIQSLTNSPRMCVGVVVDNSNGVRLFDKLCITARSVEIMNSALKS